MPTETWSYQKQIEIIRNALKWASEVQFGDIPEHTENRRKFYEPAKRALKSLEDYLMMLEMKAVRLDEMHERILNV